MDKERRNELTKLKYKKRLKQMNLITTDKNKFYCYKSTGVPCSCYICSHNKYKRTQKHKENYNID